MTEAEICSWLLGKTIGDYRLEAYLAHGAFAHVFRGRNVVVGTERAVKILDIGANTNAQLEFENEGNLLSRLVGAGNVVMWFSTERTTVPLPIPGSTLSIPIPVSFHILELADGSLDTLLAYRSLLAWADKLQMYRDVVVGLHQMKLAGICHRDLKAANCLLFPRKFNRLEVKANDLGRSRLLNSPPLPVDYSFGRGDPAFAPPEMLWLQGVDTASAHYAADLYGLGSLLFEIATGQSLTSTALGSAITWMMSALPLSEDERRARYRAEIPATRDRINAALLLLDTELPLCILGPVKDLIRALTDPDPFLRKLATAGKTYSRRDPGLLSLLRRVDIIRTIERNDRKMKPPPIKKTGT